VGGLYSELMTRAPGCVRAWRGDGRFIDVGRPADYLAAALTLTEGPNQQGRLVAAGADVAAGAVLSQTIVWPGARIGPRCRLHRCIIAGGATLDEGVEAEDCVIVPARGLSPRATDAVVGTTLVTPIAATPHAAARTGSTP
jgi:NDP-sugar pyrophosphorylase family protein